MRKELEKKIEQSIKLLQSLAPKDGSPVEVAYSGGKDSDVILQLVKESGIPYRAIYKNTTIDPKGTRKHALEQGAEVRKPNKSFFQLVAEAGFPNMFYRFCCRELKEYKILDVSIIGIRKSESRKRATRYKEPTECRYYGAKKDENKVKHIYPILEWSDNDVLDFINDRKIKLHPLYYREDGSVDVSRRLGCMGCPLKSKYKRQAEFKSNPKLLKAWLIAGNRYMQSHVMDSYSDVYAWLYRNLMFERQEHFDRFDKSNLFGKPNYKALLEEFFKCDLTI